MVAMHIIAYGCLPKENMPCNAATSEKTHTHA